ncbi:MAG: hypothetical protein IPJ85_06195 [Flavobacteriales bacterium]|nr:hypothetical protein [Flavobacteriales bacterium]
MRTRNWILPLLAALLLAPAALLAQRRTLHWVGGSGAWSDAAHWSLHPGGVGGAAVPKATDDVVVAPSNDAEVLIEGDAKCNSLRVDGSAAFVRVIGSENEALRMHGDWTMNGSVHWAFAGTVRMDGEGEGRVIDTRGLPMAGSVRFDGRGSWSIVSDLVLTQGDIVLRAGEVHAARALLCARLCAEGRGAKRLHARKQRDRPGADARATRAGARDGCAAGHGAGRAARSQRRHRAHPTDRAM